MPDFERFASANDAIGQTHWDNKLVKQCESARSVFFIPYSATYGTTLYEKLLMKPDLFINWHNCNSGGFSLRVGCSNCSSVTPPYQPQYQLDYLGLNPSNLQNKELKRSREVQQAFRSFLGEIFMDVSLMPAEYCRHLQVDLPPALQLPLSLGQGDQQPSPALPQQKID